MKRMSKAELLSETGVFDEDTHPMRNFQYYVKYKDDRGNYILRFDNGYGAIVSLERENVTPIAWRPDAKHVTEYYDVSETVHNTTFAYLEIIHGWKGSPPPF